MNVECPNCKKSFEANLFAEIPREQTIAIALESESDFFQAMTIGKTIENMTNLLSAVAKHSGSKLEVFIKSIDLKPKKIEIRFLLCVLEEAK